MEKVITDSLGNVVTMKYDEVNDSVSVKNSAVSEEFMEVIKNTSEDVIDLDVVMIPDHLEYDTWSDVRTRIELKLFWDQYKVTK
jgi:hypothetical protein